MKLYTVTFYYHGNVVLYRANQTRQEIAYLWDNAEDGLVLFDRVEMVPTFI